LRNPDRLLGVPASVTGAIQVTSGAVGFMAGAQAPHRGLSSGAEAEHVIETMDDQQRTPLAVGRAVCTWRS
jgi:hypothetical protein